MSNIFISKPCVHSQSSKQKQEKTKKKESGIIEENGPLVGPLLEATDKQRLQYYPVSRTPSNGPSSIKLKKRFFKSSNVLF